MLRVVQSVQYFLENVLIDVQNLIYGISIAFKCELNAHFWAFVTWLHYNG